MQTVTMRPLPTLLSQILVAFTVEFDNEFERRMGKAGYPGALLSLSIWGSLMRFLSEGDISVQALEGRAGLGCLERWGFVTLPRKAKSDGWGSGRGIRGEWVVRLTEKGKKATEIWPPLFGEIERRWEKRFGRDAITELKEALRELGGEGSLPELLMGVLENFAREFDSESKMPLRFCANTVRVLGEEPVPLSEIPRLTGGSPETTDIGWQLKTTVAVEPNPNERRGKVARLTPLGLKVQQKYWRLVREIEERWQDRLGKEKVRRVRECLQNLFEAHEGDRMLLAEGMIPAEGTVRAGAKAPALGRRDVGPAAKQRARDLVAQTEMFVRDPVNALPHYPLWDMNRGFGP